MLWTLISSLILAAHCADRNAAAFDDDSALLHLHRERITADPVRRLPLTTRHIPPGAKKRIYVAPKIHHSAGSVGDVTSFSKSPDGSMLNISCGSALVSLSFISMDTLRIRLGPTGTFDSPADGEIITLPKETLAASFVESSSGFEYSVGDVAVRGSFKPLMLKLYHSGSLVWQEVEPMQWNTTSTWQTFSAADSQFFGGGMQNAYSYEHTGKLILIQEPGDYDGWDAGSRSNPVPFFMSSKGYGSFRNTFKPGVYKFSQPVAISHDEFGLDAFYFLGSMKEVLQSYTAVSGRPFLLPAWGMFMGDSDCYNNKRHGYNTSTAIDVAENYSRYNMPRGWMLVNDGYGCGYTTQDMLIQTQKDEANYGLRMGLWTSTGLSNASWEISQAHSRVIKTDVGWVWEGYKFGLDAVKLAAKLMIENSNSRPYTWTVCGWAGTQKYAVIWTGDNSGSWDFIRMQIPTIIGSGLSGFAHASGDVDGIFHGSAETYVRDLQWKTFLTVSMYMSGWSPHEKQPWAFGEPYTSYNRKWLQLKSRLTPYMYSLSFQAHLTGEPPVRAMQLEFPDESWPNTEALSYQFMSGPFFLVAPVYENTLVRDNIMLPSGEWIDFTSGKRYNGPLMLNSYNCPLEDVPVFVLGGGIIPLWPVVNFFGEKTVTLLTLDLYPSIQPGKSSFKLFEDDGTTRNYALGQVATQTFEMQSHEDGSLQFCIHPSTGSYTGKVHERSYWLQVKSSNPTGSVTLNGAELDAVVDCHDDGPPAWCRSGETTLVKTPEIAMQDQACLDILPL